MELITDFGTKKQLFQEDWPGFAVANRNGTNCLYLGEWKPLMEGPNFVIKDGEHILDQLSKKITNEEFVDYLCVGEMTNLAALLLLYPKVESRIRRILICPGEKDGKCKYPVSEKNVLRDPIGAKVVMNSTPVKIIVGGESEAEQNRIIRDYLKRPFCQDRAEIFASVQTEEGRTYGSIYIDKWEICRQIPNSILIGKWQN